MKSSFFSRLSYSLGNEDWETEHKALKIQPDHRVLTITASGDRPLHLLLSECKEIVTLDANPIQNFLLELKSHALKHLDYQDYIAFLGGVPSQDREKTLHTLVESLDDSSAEFWLQNKKMVTKGILFQGVAERYACKMSYLARIVQGRKIQQLFEFEDLDKQRDYVKKNWNGFWLKKVVDLALHPKVSRILFDDPSLYAHIDSSFQPGTYFYEKLKSCLQQHLARKNFFVSLFLRGYFTEEAFPPYLTQEGSQIIKERLDRLTILTQNVIDYLESAPSESFDRFSLSDVASLLPYNQFKRLLNEVYRTAKPGARFCIRQFLSKYTVPDELAPHFQREPELEKQLEIEDRCFLYHFLVGKILK